MFFKNIWKTFNEKVLIEINSLLEEGVYPSIWKIAGRMGKANSLRSIQLATDKLEEEGYIAKDEERKIAGITELWISLLWTWEKIMRNVFNAFNIPILWSVACGLPTFAEESIEWYLSVSSDIISSYNKDEYFILRADGDSMNELWINQWDLLLIRNQKYANSGDIILALISNEEATLKEYKENNNGDFIQLIPHSNNPIHKPILIPVNRMTIQGKYIKNLWQF